MNQEQVAMLLINAMNQYVFNKIFQENNNGKVFNAEKWIEDALKLISDSMFMISPEKQQQLGEMSMNLDKYAIDLTEKPQSSKVDTPKLKLL